MRLYLPVATHLSTKQEVKSRKKSCSVMSVVVFFFFLEVSGMWLAFYFFNYVHRSNPLRILYSCVTFMFVQITPESDFSKKTNKQTNKVCFFLFVFFNEETS